MSEARRDTVSVVYALAHSCTAITVDLTTGMTVAGAIAASGISSIHPEIDPTASLVGIYGRRVSITTEPQPGDRVEIYRMLQADPKQARRARGRRNKSG
jgi:uncharacterized protein